MCVSVYVCMLFLYNFLLSTYYLKLFYSKILHFTNQFLIFQILNIEDKTHKTLIIQHKNYIFLTKMMMILLYIYTRNKSYVTGFVVTHLYKSLLSFFLNDHALPLISPNG